MAVKQGGRRLVRRGEDVQPRPVKQPPAPECCELSIVGCIEEVGSTVTAIKASLNVNQNLNVSANPSATVNAAADASADAPCSADAGAVAPTGGTPAAQSDANAMPTSKSDSNSDSSASTVTSSTLQQTETQAQDLAVISVQYRVKWHVCNPCGCVTVAGQVLDGGNVVYNFQGGVADGDAEFLTLNVFQTTAPFMRGRFTLNLVCTDAGSNTASFTDSSPKVI